MFKGTVQELVGLATKQRASDIHLVVGKPPIFRIHGELSFLEIPPLSADDLKALIFPLFTEVQREIFQKNKDIDFSHSYGREFQFRINVHVEKGNLAANVRLIPLQIGTLETLSLPPIVQEIARKRKGMVIVSGTAGTGKSTTLRYLIDFISRERRCKIITIEDPIEFIHESQKSLVIQREVGSDTEDFATAIKYALRQDPDVVAVGEMRDLESIAMALTTAETGHLILTTVHAPDAVETINRIIDVYPIGHREQIYSQLSSNLIGVIHQTLVPRKEVSGRILATEIMLGTMAIRNLIRRGALVELRGQMSSDEETGMHTLEQCLSELVRKNLITWETAQEYAKYPDMLEMPDSVKSGKSKLSAEAQAGKIGSKREKVLIISFDDEERESLALFMRNKGYSNISLAAQGKVGLEDFQIHKPDIVILALSIFYDLDSFDLCKQIKLTANKNKLIVITSNLKPKDPENAKQAGADEFVIKTTNYELLNKALDRLQQAIA